MPENGDEVLPEEVTESESVESEESTEEFDIDRAKAKINKTNREAASLRAKLKDQEADLAEWREWKNSQKSDSEKLTERATAAEKRVAELESQILRSEIAIAKGLTPAQARRLSGATKEELEEDADDLLAAFASSASSKPRASQGLRGGSDPVSEDIETDPMKLAAMVRDRR